MRAFWWFKENFIAGMARPGFNRVHWFDLPYDETLAFGWLGRHSSGSTYLGTFRDYVADYGPRIAMFNNRGEAALAEVLDRIRDHSEIEKMFARVADRTKCLETLEVTENLISFKLCEQNVERELFLLKERGINRIVALTEMHHQKEIVGTHFETHHLAIEDLNPPEFDQVVRLAEIIRDAVSKNEKIAVHCMAGIGRTSTMLMAAHLLLGEKFEEVKARLERQNPSFSFSGPQAAFIREIVSQSGFMIERP